MHPKDEFFCALRGWDHRTEHGLMERIEREFQPIAEEIIAGRVALDVVENHAVTRFWHLWLERFMLKHALSLRCDHLLSVPTLSRLLRSSRKILRAIITDILLMVRFPDPGRRPSAYAKAGPMALTATTDELECTSIRRFGVSGTGYIWRLRVCADCSQLLPGE